MPTAQSGSELTDERRTRRAVFGKGTFSGTGGTGSRRLRITGTFTGSGKTAVLRFLLPNQHCQTPQLTIKT